jgi:hypothetical protein
VIEHPAFQEQLYSTFSKFIHYGKEDLSFMIAIVNAIEEVALNTPAQIKGKRKNLQNMYERK